MNGLNHISTHGILLGAVPLVILAPVVVPWLQASPLIPE